VAAEGRFPPPPPAGGHQVGSGVGARGIWDCESDSEPESPEFRADGLTVTACQRVLRSTLPLGVSSRAPQAAPSLPVSWARVRSGCYLHSTFAVRTIPMEGP
jgi:hypothetical protein